MPHLEASAASGTGVTCGATWGASRADVMGSAGRFQTEGQACSKPNIRPVLRPKVWLIPAQGNALGSSCEFSVAGQRPASYRPQNSFHKFNQTKRPLCLNPSARSFFTSYSAPRTVTNGG